MKPGVQLALAGVVGLVAGAGARRLIAAVGYRAGEKVPVMLADAGNGQLLQADAARAFKALVAAAAQAGHTLTLTSGFRSWDAQRILYEAWQAGTGNRAAPPGYSNHQLGLSADVGGVGGYTTPAYAWLAANARRWEFVNDVQGEHWHWTFTGATAAPEGATT